VISDEHLLTSVVDFLPLGVWIARAPGGELVLANRVFREIMGLEARADVAVGEYSQPYGICTREGTPYPEDQMPFVRALQARTTVTVDDLVIHRPDGDRVAVRAFARPIFDGETITHVVIAFADITAERAAEAARRDSEERLRSAQRLEAIGTLAAGVAHDFNNAMASIRVLAALLRLRETDPGRAEDLRRIEEATDRAAALTRSLLTFGRAGLGRTSRVAVADVARSVVDLVRRTFDRQIEIRLEAGDPPADVEGDPAQIEQLLMNLLVNARDAMPEGGRIVVRVAAEGEPPVIRLEVEDSGVGIPPALRTRVFEPYFTTKRALAAPGGTADHPDRAGTGLGLSTVYGIVQQLGGTIEIGDARPRGARFTIRVPAASTLARPPTRLPAPALRRGTGRILLVEDDEPVRTSTRGLLELLGYQVLEAADGVAALSLFRQEAASIDAVLLDVIMPRQGGRATLPALRAIRPVPVLVTTGLAERHDQEEWRALGAHALLGKPYDLAQLSSVLAEAIGG
jgi:two-component system, cell cycle sensor histidine kinase and response regulator CckA